MKADLRPGGRNLSVIEEEEGKGPSSSTGNFNSISLLNYMCTPYTIYIYYMYTPYRRRCWRGGGGGGKSRGKLWEVGPGKGTRGEHRRNQLQHEWWHKAGQRRRNNKSWGETFGQEANNQRKWKWNKRRRWKTESGTKSTVVLSGKLRSSKLRYLCK